MSINAALARQLAAIAQAPEGPQIGAFFDYDGTLIDGYSAAAYLVDRIKRGEMSTKEIVDTVKLARRKDISDEEFVEVIGNGVVDWAGMTEDELRAIWQRLWLAKTATTLFPESWQLIEAHKKRGHTIAIASSATLYQVEPLAREYGIEHLICTRAMLRNGRLTGGLDGPPAWGEGKAEGVRAFAKSQGVDLAQSYGYANGDEDIAFLKAVGHASPIQPKPKLEAVAQELGWPILRFPRRSRGSAGAIARTVGAYAAMGASFVAGLGLERLTGDPRRATNFITTTASDAAMAVLGVTIEVVGREHLHSARPCVFIINHQSKFDMFVMMNIVRESFSGVAKAEAAHVPGFGRYMKMAGVAFLDRADSKKSIDALGPAVERIKSGLSMCIAPEGTRSWTPKLGRFKKGAFHMAMQAGVPIVPVVIRNAGEIMGRNDQVMRAGTVQVAVLPPVDVSGWRVEELDSRIAEVHRMYVDTLEHWPANDAELAARFPSASAAKPRRRAAGKASAP